MTFPALAANSPSGYNLTKSLRFRSSASAYMNRTPSVTGNQQKFTLSLWLKIGSGDFNIFAGPSSGDRWVMGVASIANGGAINPGFNISGVWYDVITTQVLRDPSAWYHIVLAFDTTQATAANRYKIYVNGVQSTAIASGSYCPQNSNTAVNTGVLHKIGNYSTSYSDGYLAEFNFIDGQQLTPSSFGSTNPVTGVWQPIKYTGTYGTNGFYLPFTNTTSTTTLGYDSSGNGNNWTTNNFSLTAGSTYDSMTDVPTLTSATAANYCVLNPISNPNGTIVTYSNGNLNFSHSASSGNAPKMTVQGTMAIPANKFYWEYRVGATVNDQVGIGTMLVSGGSADGTAGARYANDGTFGGNYTNPSSGASYTTSDVIGIAYDQPNGTLAFYKNNSLQGTITAISTTQVFFPLRSVNSSATGGAGSFNFGQQGFTYTPPSGFVALNTFNLPDSIIVAGNKVMDATTYTGNGTSLTVANAGSFKPDFVWVKRRSNSASHRLGDSVRGVNNSLYSNSTSAEVNNDGNGYISAITSTGFTVSTGSTDAQGTNFNGDTYVAWQWQAGQGTTSSNTSGSITSTVSVNATAGFSVVTYTGTGAAATIGHSLGIAPKMIICKSRGATGNWVTYHTSIGAGNVVFLDLSDASTATTAAWNNTAPTSSVFSVAASANSNPSGVTVVAYCWSEIAGFSKFGSYTGNGSTDGVFCYTGFRPKYVMIKLTSGAADWIVEDTSINTYNQANTKLSPNSSGAEYTNAVVGIDFLSNGFKLRNTDGALNGSSSTYIYAAFAENPFKNALAR